MTCPSKFVVSCGHYLKGSRKRIVWKKKLDSSTKVRSVRGTGSGLLGVFIPGYSLPWGLVGSKGRLGHFPEVPTGSTSSLGRPACMQHGAVGHERGRLYGSTECELGRSKLAERKTEKRAPRIATATGQDRKRLP